MTTRTTRIASLVEEVKNAYPPERLAASKHRMSAAWAGEPSSDAIPFVFRCLPPPADPELAACAAQTTHEEALLCQLGMILERSVLNDDYVPGLSPGLRQLTLPSLFGARDENHGGHDWVMPLITEPDDVYRLSEPNYGGGTMAAFMLERANYFLEMTDGQIGVNIPDLQGPFSVASQLWGVQEFLMAVYEYPEHVAELMRRTTEATIGYISQLREAIGEHLVPIHCHPDAWMPSTAGMCISEDLIAVVSPRICREYINPSLDAVGRAFGQCYAHTCGDAQPCVDALLEVEHLKGMNFSTCETNFEQVAARTKEQWVLFPHRSPVATAHMRILSPEEHVQTAFRAMRTHHVPGFVHVDRWPDYLPPSHPDMQAFCARVRDWANGM